MPMSMESLVCNSNQKETELLRKELAELNSWDFVGNGKEAQQHIYKRQFNTIFLDVELEDHSGIAVLRYIKSTLPHQRVILITPSKNRLDELGLGQKELARLGIPDVLMRPITAKSLQTKLEELNASVSWKNVQSIDASTPQAEAILSDTKFTKIRVEEFFGGEISVFDVYIRIGKDKYLKLFNKGEPYDNSRVKEFSETKNVEWLYFLTAERVAFINYLNEIADKAMKSDKYTSKQKLILTKNVANQYLNEIETRGIRQEIIKEGEQLCESMLSICREDESLAKLLKEFEEIDPQAFSESFLTAFFSSMIVSKLPWGTKSTVEKVVMGALLHDLGRLKLPPALREKRADKMTEEELKQWREHPRLGVEMLDSSQFVSEATKQIVYQHHEYVNGTGFPNGLTGLKIFPLAKVVSFANGFAEFIVDQKLSPLDGLKVFLKTRGVLEKYDPVIIKTFLTCFIHKTKPKGAT